MCCSPVPNNLTPGGNEFFLRAKYPSGSRQQTRTVLVAQISTAQAGGNSDSTAGGLSTNGQFILFESAARADLVSGMTNGVSNIFLSGT